ncbi:unnamed protein product [Linum tenue]|uniref:Protein MIZU-KUSSEI 1-like n=1 Tax=Linum tenue TaxID=586396 RepID=A0AAV0KKZ1_9ROSI|nr:unnamed protein product [Linum tenue]
MAAAAAITSVECQSQVKSWRLFRSLLAFLIPTCNCTTFSSDDHFLEDDQETKHHQYPINPKPSAAATLVTGTIFGSRRGKISLCFQTHRSSNNKSPNILLLLELAVPAPILAREMESGVLRIALRSTAADRTGSPLTSVPAWTTYCNGRRAGYAVRRRPTEADVEALRVLGSVAVGAGVMNDEVTYLRANFQRRRASGGSGSESFHLVDPDGSIGQELSIYLFR